MTQNLHWGKEGDLSLDNPFLVSMGLSDGPNQHSKGFGVLDDDTREEVFKRYKARMEALTEEFKHLDHDWALLNLMRRHAISKPAGWRCGVAVCNKVREMKLPFGVVKGMTKEKYIEKLDYQINEISIKRDAVKKELDDFAPWKLDLLKKAPGREEMA